MNIDFLTFLLFPIIKDKDYFSIIYDEKQELNHKKIFIYVSQSDIRKIIGYGGKVYRSIKTILKYGLKCSSLDLIIDVTNKQKSSKI